jgi:F-type H+-transporting ATPase subunit epsilon
MFKLSIVSPERIMYEDDVISLIVPGGEGYLGVLTDHAPLISTLKVGEITFKTSENREVAMATSGGFIEVSDNVASILVDTAEFVEQIDMTRAEAELRRAGELLNMELSPPDRETAKHSHDKAHNRIELIKKYR